MYVLHQYFDTETWMCFYWLWMSHLITLCTCTCYNMWQQREGVRQREGGSGGEGCDNDLSSLSLFFFTHLWCIFNSQAIQNREELTERVQETEDEMELVLGDLHKTKTELTKLKQVCIIMYNICTHIIPHTKVSHYLWKWCSVCVQGNPCQWPLIAFVFWTHNN